MENLRLANLLFEINWPLAEWQKAFPTIKSVIHYYFYLNLWKHMFCERTTHHLERGHIDLKCLVFWSRKGYHLQSVEFALFQKYFYAADSSVLVKLGRIDKKMFQLILREHFYDLFSLLLFAYRILQPMPKLRTFSFKNSVLPISDFFWWKDKIKKGSHWIL